MNNDVKKPDESGLTANFTPAAFITECRVSELIEREGMSESDSIMATIKAGQYLSHTPI